MRELGVDATALANLFEIGQGSPYIVARVPASKTTDLPDLLGSALRRAYVSDEALAAGRQATGLPEEELVRAKLPDRGATMSGDFGEFLTSVLQAILELPGDLLDPKKFRLKQDRLKPAPKSDVVQLLVPAWPTATTDDRVLCAEVKTKALRGPSTPIHSAISDSVKDQDSRLIKTLVWLRERSLYESLGSVTRAHLDRFIEATDYPPAERLFRAVAVISSDLFDDEVGRFDISELGPHSLVLVSVPDLKAVYEAVFDAAATIASDAGDVE